MSHLRHICISLSPASSGPFSLSFFWTFFPHRPNINKYKLNKITYKFVFGIHAIVCALVMCCAVLCACVRVTYAPPYRHTHAHIIRCNVTINCVNRTTPYGRWILALKKCVLKRTTYSHTRNSQPNTRRNVQSFFFFFFLLVGRSVGRFNLLVINTHDECRWLDGGEITNYNRTSTERYAMQSESISSSSSRGHSGNGFNIVSHKNVQGNDWTFCLSKSPFLYYKIVRIKWNLLFSFCCLRDCHRRRHHSIVFTPMFTI